MKFQLFSDLHTDVTPHKGIRIADGIDAVVVPGDVCQGAERAFSTLRSIVPADIPIAFVLGNHEFYGKFLPEELEKARAVAPGYGVMLLERNVATIAGVRFVGATTWTDYRLFGDAKVAAAMATARSNMNDHRRIGWQKSPWKRFRPLEASMIHNETRTFLADALATDEPTVVVSHHAPSMLSVADKFRDDLLTAAYASSLAHDLLEKSTSGATDPIPVPRNPMRADIWCHGHTHNSSDYYLVGTTTRVISNPHGYGDENALFDPSLVLELVP